MLAIARLQRNAPASREQAGRTRNSSSSTVCRAGYGGLGATRDSCMQIAEWIALFTRIFPHVQCTVHACMCCCVPWNHWPQRVGGLPSRVAGALNQQSLWSTHGARWHSTFPIARERPHTSPVWPLQVVALSFVGIGDGQVVGGGCGLRHPSVQEDGHHDKQGTAAESPIWMETEERDGRDARE